MNKQKFIEKYLEKYGVKNKWKLISGPLDYIESVVVIPALAEKNSLFNTLLSLSKNLTSELERTLVLCVINNREEPLTSGKDIADNRKTIKLLNCLIANQSWDALTELSITPQLHLLSQSNLRLAYVDSSSPGLEMPKKKGRVGLARKIGMDLGLQVLNYEKPGPRLLFSLDADTLVEDNYLSSGRTYFEKENKAAAVFSFQHQNAGEPLLQSAIYCYEIFLRYYVLGLSYAGSGYAFHSIGSTMICTAEGYAAVRGMNKREAGEDFYFLNKLAKLNGIGSINNSRVYPSARPSKRVPFGTGQRIIRFKEGGQNEYLLYDPRVFRILKQWLDLMSSGFSKDTRKILSLANKIHPSLEHFLEINKFDQVWPRLICNNKSPFNLTRQLATWFDGFKVLKLIHYLTENCFPKIEMFGALRQLLKMMQSDLPIKIDSGIIPGSESQKKLLQFLQNFESSHVFKNRQ